MSLLPETFASFLRWIAETSLQVALLCVVVLAVEAAAWRWLSARSRLWLWTLVLARLVLPPVPAPDDASIVSDAKLMSRIAPRASEPGREAAPLGESGGDAAVPAVERRRDARAVSKLPPLGSFPVGIDSAEPAAASAGVPPAESAAIPLLPFVIAGVWAAGFCGVLLLTFVRERRFRTRLRAAEVGRDPILLAEIASAARALGLRRDVEVLLTDAVSGPAATGIRRARLLLPRDFTASHEPAARRCVLLHELAHLRHRDALVDAGLVVLRAAFWFHPLVHVALRRLRQAREELRDDQALSVPDAPPPASYARTLLSALERGRIEPTTPALAFLRGHEWTRRLTMIQNHGKRSGVAHLASGLAIVGLGAGVLLGASTTNFVAPVAPGMLAPEKLDRVRVEGYAQWPQWREDLERTFERTLPELKFADMNLRDALSSLAFLADLNVILDPEIDVMLLEEPVAVAAKSVTVRDALDILLGLSGQLGYECFDRGIRIASRDAVKPETETRFYSLSPFVEGIDDPDRKQEVFNDLITLLRAYADPKGSEDFDLGRWSIGTYRDLLVLHADRSMHSAAKQLLERLLGPIEEVAKASAAQQPYREIVERALTTRVSLAVESEPLHAALAMLQESVGISIHADRALLDEAARCTVKDAMLRDVLLALGRPYGLHPTIRSGVIVLSGTPDSTVEIHEIGGLVPLDGDERIAAIDSLHEVIRSQIDPTSWDTYPSFSFSIFKDRLVVRQTPENQIALRRMLAALEKALGNSG